MKKAMWFVLLVSVFVLAACGGGGSDPQVEKSEPKFSAEGETCESIYHAFYYATDGTRVDVATMTHELVIAYSYYDTWDGADHYSIYFENDNRDDLDEVALAHFQQQIADFAGKVTANLKQAGYPMVYLSYYEDLAYYYDDEPSDNLYYDSWRDDEQPFTKEQICSSVDVYVQISLEGEGSWEINNNHLTFNDEQSRVDVYIPELAYFVVGKDHPSRVETNMYVGDPAEISYPRGSFRLVYGSPNMSYLRQVMNAFPFQVVYQTQPDGVTFGVFADPE